MKPITLLLVTVLALFGCSKTPTDTVQPQAAGAVSASLPEGSTIEAANGQFTTENAQVNKYFNKGDNAYYSASSSGDNYMSISIDRDFVSNTTWLYYYVRINGVTVENGYGYIPNSDVTGSYEDGWMQLNTNTSAASNPNFYRSVGSGGQVTASWSENGEWQQESAGYTKYTRGDGSFAYASRSKWWYNSANASGKVAGWGPMSYPYGYVGRHDYKHVSYWAN